MYADSEPLVASTPLRGVHPKARAKVSNDLFLLRGTDNRSVAARRYRDVVRSALFDIGRPEAALSESEREQLRTLGLLTIRLDALQERALAEEPDSETELGIVRLANSLARLRWQLGIARRKRADLGPDPIYYAQQQAKAGAR